MKKTGISSKLKRNPCAECDFYVKKNNTCQSKKCATCGNRSKVSLIDRLFCEPYKQKGENA